MDDKEIKDIFARALEECNDIICDNINIWKKILSQWYDKVLYKMIAVSYDYRHNDTTYENFISPRDMVLWIDMTLPIECPKLVWVISIDWCGFSVAELSNWHLIPTYSITVEDR